MATLIKIHLISYWYILCICSLRIQSCRLCYTQKGVKIPDIAIRRRTTRKDIPNVAIAANNKNGEQTLIIH